MMQFVLTLVGGACAMYTCTTHDWLVSTSSSSRQSNSGHLVRSGSSVTAVRWCASAYLFEPSRRYRDRLVFYVKSKIPRHILLQRRSCWSTCIVMLLCQLHTAVDHDPLFVSITHGGLPLQDLTSCTWKHAIVLGSVLCTCIQVLQHVQSVHVPPCFCYSDLLLAVYTHIATQDAELCVQKSLCVWYTVETWRDIG
jgi:hypothetical protein